MVLALAIVAPATAAAAPRTVPEATGSSVARPPAGVTAPRAVTAAAAKNKVLAGQFGNLSVITPAGDLIMYYHHGWISGTADFSPGYDHGDGWNAFSKVVSFGVAGSYDNMYLATTSGGLMYAYYWKHLEQRWVNPSGTLVGSGWQGTQKLISGGNRKTGNTYGQHNSFVYRVTDSGELYWYEFSGIPGEGGGFTNSKRIGPGGWGNFQYVAASRGEFFAIPSNGDVNWYVVNHTSGNWWNDGLPQIINRGFYGGTCGYQTVQGGGDNTLYAVDSAGRLRWMQHSFNEYGHYWYPESGCGAIVGTGWM